MFFAGAFYFWRLGDKWAARPRAAAVATAQHRTSNIQHPTSKALAAPFKLLTQAGTFNVPPTSGALTNHASRVTNRLALRLSNTSTPLRQLQRDDHALLLENALLDTTRPVPAIPDHLRAHGDSGSYLVQARGPIDNAFRSLLQAVGATIVSYIPNNAYLVRASAAMAQQLQVAPQTQVVLPYEPYYKLKPSLLELAVAQAPLPDNTELNVLLFADVRETTLAELGKLGVRILGEERSPFGPVLKVLPPADSLPALASLTGVHEVELVRRRVPANDLSRVAVGVSTNTVTDNNYLGLTGADVLVNINDTGVDATHLDLAPRVLGDSTNDPNGHGTHVAGIIAGNGSMSATVSNVQGSIMPAVARQFRGKAPAARLFSLLAYPDIGPDISDAYLQEAAARTNAFISNNSWNYLEDYDYDLHAASYDAAVRDARPLLPGSQPVLFVFAAGDDGNGDTDGTGGVAGRVLSPATAKNVISVGALEQLRGITNQPATNDTSWLLRTDSSNQVAYFSSRGNVGINIEGYYDSPPDPLFGRFKPDVVAPGEFVVSTRSKDWTAGFTSVQRNIARLLTLGPNQEFDNYLSVPDNALQVTLRVLTNFVSPLCLTNFTIFINTSGNPGPPYDLTGTNQLSISNPPNAGGFWFYAISNTAGCTVVFDLLTDIVVPADVATATAVSNLNSSLAPYYRYESGTSMAAANVSGVLALMQQFFQSNSLSYSPALMKALLINGARTAGDLYDFSVTNASTLQGWGLINLTNSLPAGLANPNAAANSMFFRDQSPTNSLATGQGHTYQVTVSETARAYPLRVTLVWTDPPGDPAAGTKLVNDLDLIVTNRDNPSEFFYGNDLRASEIFNFPATTNSLPDRVNNVENVFLLPAPLAASYSITVRGGRVNVNAVTAQTNDVVQDYALVVSSGDGKIANGLTFAPASAPLPVPPPVTVVSNTFSSAANASLYGGILANQRAGANTPLLGTNTIPLTNGASGVLTLGMTNQWHFYVISNLTSFTNAVFATFAPPDLSVPRMGVREQTVANATRPEADIDLYVAPPSIPNNYALTNLDPAVIEATDKSLSRGGTETIIYSNAMTINSTNAVYYVGVKCEDHMAAQYSLQAVFSLLPFGSSDNLGNQTIVGIGTPAPIPDGDPVHPGGVTIPAFCNPMLVRRVVVSNTITHQLMGDLIGFLENKGIYVTLNNKSPETTVVNKTYIYDDSNEGDIPGARPTDGPGWLNDFAGKEVGAQWQLTMVDNALNHTGSVDGLVIWLEKQQPATGGGIFGTTLPNRCTDEFIPVPLEATSLTITATTLSGPGQDLYMQVCQYLPVGPCFPPSGSYTNVGAGVSITFDRNSIPPLVAGATYVVYLCNSNSTTAVNWHLVAKFGFGPREIPTVTYSTNPDLPIADDAVTYAAMLVTNHLQIASLDVGLLINDPRISDLAITLISPCGTRILLFEDRGGTSTNGLGSSSVATNYFMTPFYTNNFDLAPVGLYAPGAAFQGWNVVSNLVDVLDDFTCLCLSNHILALLDGAVSNSLPTTNSVPPTNSNPYTLTYRVNHLPWLEGMVTWWPLDVDGSDIFGGLDGLLLGDVAFTTGSNTLFFDDFSGPALNPAWQAVLPDNAPLAGYAIYPETYIGAPNYAFQTLGANSVLRMTNTLSPQTRCGWSSAAGFTTSRFRYEARFNTLNQSATNSIDGFIEIWLIDAANMSRYDLVGPNGANASANRQFCAGSSIDNLFTNRTFAYQNNTWYRLVLACDASNKIRASLCSDDGTELIGQSFNHGAAAFPSGFKIALSQAMGIPSVATPADVAVDYVKLTSGLSGEVNQAYVGDGIATRMVVPACPALDLGRGRGLSIEGWINPFDITNPAPLVEWYDPAAPTNQSPLGVQFWVGLTNGPGSLAAILWDTNSRPHTIATAPLALTNGNWQHVALTYDTNSTRAVLYTNGQPAAAVHFPAAFVPHTSGDLYLGFDPTVVPTPINFADFSSIAGLNLVGNAGQNGAVLRLTPAAQNQMGSAWATNKQPCASGFRTSFQFQFSNPGSGGGDGVGFVVQNLGPNSDVWGGQGNWTNYVSVFFNTAWNWPGNTDYTHSDISGNSVGIRTNELYVTQVDLTPLGINLKDGAVHQSRITFDGATMSVWLDGIMLFTNVPLPGMASALDAAGKAWVGLGAFSGSAWENQDILSWTFGGSTPGTSFAGGLDEFSVYQRALSPGEVNAIFNAGSRGKYGTNVLVCPVATEVTLLTASGSQTYAFTNGFTWTNSGPQWETNTISFSTSTNPTAIIVRGLNPYNPADTSSPNNLNAVVDDFVLSELVPQSIDGLVHFTEDTNLATTMIKFATNFVPTYFPPILIFSNDFENATPGVYQAGATIQGGTNSPGVGARNWTVTQGSVTVVSNVFFDAVGTNWLAMATGTVQCLLPTIANHRYELSYNLRGPCAVGWWNGSVDPLSQRAQDLISGNNGAFFYGATNVAPGFVGNQGFFFLGQTEPPPAQDPDIFPEDTDDPSSSIQLGDPPQLQFTNAFTIEGWINPIVTTNDTPCGRQQIFFRGYPEPLDCNGVGDPYWLALDPTAVANRYDLHFHIADAHAGTLGADVLTTNGVIQIGGGSNGGWWHIAAVFDKPFTNVTVLSGTNVVTITTNALRLYLNGACIATNYTTLSPYQTLDPALSPGAAIGDRSRYDWTQPFSGFMDELTVYARALTDPEIAAIAAAGADGKADPSVPAAQSLAELTVSVDGVQLGLAYGDNSQWSTHTVQFTALDTNAVATFESLLPGTLLDGITLTEVSHDLDYLPEVSLDNLIGEDAYGLWQLELWDTRVGATNAWYGGTNRPPELLTWQLNFQLVPISPPPVIYLSHGIPYTNTIPANSIQYFVVQVPQWATMATNNLLFSTNYTYASPAPVGVLFDTNAFPTTVQPAAGPPTNTLFWPPVSIGTVTISTNVGSLQPLVIGQSYYLAVTNPNLVAVTFALEVAFDITTLANCQATMSVVGPAGIPRYLQFDVPTNGVPSAAAPQQVAFWLTGANSNLTVVLSEHLPLPDLDHYDYISQQPCTNDEIVMVFTNSTPFPIQTNRWYVGVFNTTATNVSFAAQACVNVGSPLIIPLTNGVPFVAPLPPLPGSLFAAPPGPPQRFFFDFFIGNAVPGVLFELYNLSGDADLVLQREVPPAMAPYFDGSFFPGLTPEQIVVRTDADVPDLRGHWYLGIYNNEKTNVAYTLRAVLPDSDGLLVSAQALQITQTTLNPPQGLLLSWNSVEGESYFVQYTASLASPVTWTNLGLVVATTPLTTFEILPVPTGPLFYRVVQAIPPQPPSLPTLHIQLWPTNQVRLSWSTAYPGYTLQSKTSLFGTWADAGLTVTVIGNEYVAFDTIGSAPKFYRLFK
jgi:subtilisin-like proprotein convertase family protein